MVERVITCVHSLRERLDETLLAHRNEILALHSRKGILQHHQIILEFEAILKENRKKLADGAFFEVLKASQKAFVLPPWVALTVRPRPGVWE
ncbi:sucrose synthase-like [Gossypium australe]|uniref:sucrose synthase n=1 Tax=Gossypium australe TaxID=47621 RepID=A0A5B6UFE3_9ROSI|nr:sucrose synthase-like [Gossypium australe]